MIELREYLDRFGRGPFSRWFNKLDSVAAARVAIALQRMQEGNFSNAKSVGEGVGEYKIDFGPGYRLYFGRDGAALIILLSGGTKKRQQDDIATAKDYWADYKRRKSGAS
jgi:putative addiction module killer protein